MSKRECLIAELYRSQYEDLLRLARVLLHNEEDARDAVSDVMTRLIDKQQAKEENSESFLLPEGERLLAYTRSCVRFECLNRLKRMKLQERMRRALPLDDEEISTHDEDEKRYQDYQLFIQTELTPQTRRVFQLHYGQQLKYREIAKLTNISEAAVYKHLSQAIIKLKNRFNP